MIHAMKRKSDFSHLLQRYCVTPLAVCGLLGCAANPPQTRLPPAANAEIIVASLDPTASLIARYHTTPVTPPSEAARKEFAPAGTMRIAINYGNPILATRDNDGDPQGVSVDIARELARRLGLPIKLIVYQSAGKVFEGAGKNEWDVAFFAIDPARAVEAEFTAPYLEIEGAYLVRQDSPIRQNADVDRVGTKVVVGAGSAYDLFLTRAIKAATLVRASTSPAVVDVMVRERADVAAGVRQQLAADAKRIGGLRFLDGRFMKISQAMAVPKGRLAARQYLAGFVEEIKVSGVLSDALRNHKIDGVAIAPNATSASSVPRAP